MPRERYEIRDDGPQLEQRIGTTRTASEPRGPPIRGYSQREGARRQPPRRMPDQLEEEEEVDDYPGELYDMYRNSRGSRPQGRQQQRPRYIEEEDEYASEYEDGSFDEGEFEMVSSRPPARTRTQSTSGRGQSRKPDIRKVRVKVHSTDVRYIMVGTAVEFPDLVDKIRDKFVLKKRFKIKVKDDDMPDGDMITLGDQDDLDMVMMGVKSAAKRERADMGKLEVSIFFTHLLILNVANQYPLGLGSGRLNKRFNDL